MAGSGSARRDVARAMAEAAANFLDTLDTEQARVGAWPWPTEESETERRRWFYTPTDHGGLTMHQLAPAQQRAVMRLLAAGLSEPGYVTMATVMGLENVLDRYEGFVAGFARERGRDPGMYFIRVFGTPGESGTWAWRFGGHHVSINQLVVDGQVVASTPCFLGAHPAVAPLLGGRENRPLGAVEDIARELVNSLDAEQRAAAVLTDRPPVDLVSGNRTRFTDGDKVLPLPQIWRGHFTGEYAAIEERLWAVHHGAEQNVGFRAQDGDAVALTARPKGIAATDLGAGQRDTLRELLEVYIGRMPSGVVELERSAFEGPKLDEVRFAWAGGLTRGEPHYYRVQGTEILAEWENAQPDLNHVHSLWRHPTRDFGIDLLARHHADFPHT